MKFINSQFNYKPKLCINVRKIKTSKITRQSKKQLSNKLIIHNNCIYPHMPRWIFDKLDVQYNLKSQVAKNQYQENLDASAQNKQVSRHLLI
jgi:hypothetical protein